jgi:hypothetical protein
MRIAAYLDNIDNGSLALPEFQRGYVWNRDQVRGLMESLYRRHPVGSLLVWVTESPGAQHRGDAQLSPGVVKLLLDGQQRITSLYGIARGAPPPFFDGNADAFRGLMFHLEREEFGFYQPVNMGSDPLWIDVTALLRQGTDGVGPMVQAIQKQGADPARFGDYFTRLNRLVGILEIGLHAEEITGADKTIDVVVDIFNRVNSGGTKLSKGDLALAKICAEWPEARDEMKAALESWRAHGFDFNLDWLLRNVNTVATGEARFHHLHAVSAGEVEEGLAGARRHIDTALNMIGGRLGLDHDRVLFGRFAIPVITRYLDRRGGSLGARERDRLLFWFVQAGMWGRFSGSTETMIDQDLAALEEPEGGLDRLIEQLRLWHGGLRVEPAHFRGYSIGARFYPVLYMLTRVTAARDLGSGLELKAHLLGRMNALEVHHIFPKSLLYEAGYSRYEANGVANFCFLTKDSNLRIGNRAPEEYFRAVEEAHPGVLASQFIPTDPKLWRIDAYPDFLAERQRLLAEATNALMLELLHGDGAVIGESAGAGSEGGPRPLGGVASAGEDTELRQLQAWVAERGFDRGRYLHEVSDEATGEALAVLDLAWPEGLQRELSEPVALLLDEGPELLALANRQGYRCFTDIASFKDYVARELLGEDAGRTAA